MIASTMGPRIAMSAIGVLATAIIGYAIHANIRVQEIVIPSSSQKPLIEPEVQEAEAQFSNAQPIVRSCVIDFSGSYAQSPGSSCRHDCKGMKETAIARCREDLGVPESATAVIAGGTAFILASFGTTSFNPETLYRTVSVKYPSPPALPDGWDDPNIAERSHDALADIVAAVTRWRQWRDRAAETAAVQHKAISAAFQALEDREAENVTDIVSAVERLMLQSAQFPAASFEHRLFTDLEEALGDRLPHSDAELGTWCAIRNLSFPKQTRVILYVSTRAASLQSLIARWKPFFAGCGIDNDDVVFLPLSRENIAQK